MRDTERETEAQAEREKQDPCREIDVGLDPGSPGSLPGPKAGAKTLSHPGVPSMSFKSFICQWTSELFPYFGYSAHWCY